MKKAPPDLPVSITDLERRLSMGEDPQALLKEVVDTIVLNAPVDVPARSRREQSLLYPMCIDLLSNHGARVAPSDSNECALQSLSRIPFRQAPRLLAKVTFGLLNKQGEFPFHVLAKELPMNFWNGVFFYEPAYASTLQAVDPLGRTVSHLLWDPENTMSKARQSMLDERDPALKKTRNIEWMVLVRAAWDMQKNFQKWGVGMDKPDNEGRTAMDLCVDRLEAGDAAIPFERTELDICLEAQTRLNNRIMHAGTAQAGISRPAPRL